jgi:hypothetical protein
VNQHILGPTEFAGHTQVEFPLQGVFATLQYHQIVAPANLCNQWLHPWIIAVEQVELPHIEDIPPGETRDTGKFQAQIRGELIHDGGAMTGISLPLRNHSPDVPIEADQLCFSREYPPSG